MKIHFQLEQDEDGYPPFAVESLWASPGESDCEFVIDNIPFFVREATLGDVVVAVENEEGWWYARTSRRSDNSLIRVVFFDEGESDRVRRQLEQIGCEVEVLEQHNLFALNVPATVPLADVQAQLQSEAAADILDYEEPILRQ